uniref:Uncharacterized protein n=1 Tax=Helianthus annuus TaxID=4232 RepID=A0A251RRI6_HELAN
MCNVCWRGISRILSDFNRGTSCSTTSGISLIIYISYILEKSIIRTSWNRHTLEGNTLNVMIGTFRMAIKHVLKNQTQTFEASALV